MVGRGAAKATGQTEPDPFEREGGVCSLRVDSGASPESSDFRGDLPAGAPEGTRGARMLPGRKKPDHFWSG
jgi:hypothetical protein